MAERLAFGNDFFAVRDVVGKRHHVAYYRACGGEGARARAVEHGLAHGVADDEHGVHGARDACELVRCRNHGGVHAHVDAAFGVASNGEQLNGVAELARHFDIGGGNVTNALHEHIVGVHARAEADGSEDRDLRSSIEAVDVGRGVGLGVTQALRVGEHLIKAQAFVGHARKNVVRGAVHNAGDGQNFVADQVVLERAHHGNAASCSGFALDLHAVAVREFGQVLNMTAEQRLVRGNHVLAVRERVLENFRRGMFAANELDHDVDIGVARDVLPVGGEDICDAEILRFCIVAAACALNLKVDAVVLNIIVVVALNKAHYASTDSSQTNNANVDAAHSRLLIFGVRVSPIVAHMRVLAARIRQVQKTSS